MQKLVFTIFILLQCFLGRSQLYVQSGAGFKTTGDVQITLDGAGVTNNDASADFSNAILNFKGANTVSINGTGTWAIKKIILDKPTYQLVLGSPIQITGQLQLVNGILDLNNQMLTLTPAATIEGENSMARITGSNGGVVQTTISLNAPVALNPGNIGAQITSNQNLGSVIIRRWHKPDGNSTGKVLRFYEIVPTNNTSLNANLRLYYLDPELNNNQENSLDLFTRSNAQNVWVTVTGTNKDATVNYIEKSGLASLQQYSLGINAMALPLTWGSVSASCRKGNIEVKWSTLQESRIYNFIVQRTTDGSAWIDLASVPASGSSTSVNNYSYIDATATAGVILNYRIAAVQNETYSYSAIASTTGCKKTIRMQLAPVPAITTTSLSVYSEDSYQAAIRLYGTDGRTYQQRTVKIIAGYCQFQFDVSRIPSGSYYLQVDQPDGSTETISFIKQ